MSEGPYLLVDAGNSRIKWLLSGGANGLSSTGALTHAEMPAWSDLPRPSGAWVSNVAGEAVQERIDSWIDAHWPGLSRMRVKAQAQQLGVSNRYAEPAALGSDRWCGMIGAHAAYPGENLLIATFGTATTLEALSADGVFAGGLIAPGWQLMMQSLGRNTAQLPTLSADTARDALGLSTDIFATDTPAALSSGCLLAQAGLIERAWHDLGLQWKSGIRLILGGGAADVVASALKVPHTRHDSLVLEGLDLIARSSTSRA